MKKKATKKVLPFKPPKPKPKKHGVQVPQDLWDLLEKDGARAARSRANQLCWILNGYFGLNTLAADELRERCLRKR